MGSLLFTTSFFLHRDLNYRYLRYLNYYKDRKKFLDVDNILFIDDGSIKENILLNIPTFNVGSFPKKLPEVSMFRFNTHLGRSRSGFPGWWRSFLLPTSIIDKYEINKLIHIESDSYILSKNLFSYISSLSSGWTSLWSKLYSWPAIRR